MAARFGAVKRPVYLYFRFLGQQMKAILAYEADFVILLFAAVIIQIVGFAFIWTIFQRIPSINGWTLWQVLMMYSLIFITEGVVSLFFEGTWRLGWLVYSGQFDQMLVRPVSPIVQVLAGAVGFNGLGNIVTGGILFAVSLSNVHTEWTLGRVAMIPVLVISGAMIRIALTLGAASSAFWVRNPFSMVPMFIHQMGEFAKYPITIYSVAVQAVIVVAVPFAFISFFPTAFLFGMDAWSLPGMLTPLVAVYCLIMAVSIFRHGMKNYESSGH